jgi:hypothetical protein
MDSVSENIVSYSAEAAPWGSPFAEPPSWLKWVEGFEQQWEPPSKAACPRVLGLEPESAVVVGAAVVAAAVVVVVGAAVAAVADVVVGAAAAAVEPSWGSVGKTIVA